MPRHTLAIDFGAKYVGLALIRHGGDERNQTVYAATVVIERKPLEASVQGRSGSRRIRRTKKTHQRRLRHLQQAIGNIPGGNAIIRFCARRGFSHDAPEEQDAVSFRYSREEFFAALECELSAHIAPADIERVRRLCETHLNRSRSRDAELRPARFLNRGPTQCNWDQCHRRVPKSSNAIYCRLQQSLFVWLKPTFDASARPEALRKSIEHFAHELEALAVGMRRLREKRSEESGNAKKEFAARKKRIFKRLLECIQRETPPESFADFQENWREYYRDQISEILSGKESGRVRYCLEHSRLFVDHFLTGRVIPQRTDLELRDLTSRTQQIIFAKIWSFVERRLLPLAGGRIERVVVERVAIDLLAGKFKDRRSVSDDTASAIYWQGPMLGFADRLSMLRAEFDGRCAYCEAGRAEEVEHLLPSSRFPFDSYFNILPACSGCNHKKGGRSLAEAAMQVTAQAYESYCEFVRQRKPVPHRYHTIKKGLLKLLTQPGFAASAERMIGLIGANLVTIADSQRAPRPLARYLATQLLRRTGFRPACDWQAGRHTALYRSIVLPDYDKPAAKADDDIRNHAVDAILLGCEFPSASAFENREWVRNRSQVGRWFDEVRAASPQLRDGLPEVPEHELVPWFETNLGSNFVRLDLSTFNWNKRRQGTQALDPYGATKTGLPLKREPGASILAKLMTATDRAKKVPLIAHPRLRATLEAAGEQAARAFVIWLQESVRAGNRNAGRIVHPADIQRHRTHEQFANADVEDILEGKTAIPPTIGVKCVNLGARGQLDATRVDREGRIIHRYKSDPVVRELVVGYCAGGSEIDRSKPILFFIDQGMRVRQGLKKEPLKIAADSPLNGRSFGGRERWSDYQRRWQAAFEELCREQGIAMTFRIASGCVIEKLDGQRVYWRNFKKDMGLLKVETFRNIGRIHRSPLTSSIRRSSR